MDRLYFDFNATRPLRPASKIAMLTILDELGNPSSVHTHGRKMRDAIEDARQEIAIAIKVDASRLIFVSGATEANNLIQIAYNGPVIVSAIEHSSVLQVRGDAQICPVTKRGIVCLDQLETMLKASNIPPLVCIMAANNETGIIQPMDEITALVHAHGGFLHCDAVQGIGKIPLCCQAFDSFTLSSHKIGGPFGAGVLGINPRMTMYYPFKGGGQERSIRPGTENVWGIVGMAEAIKLCMQENWSSTETQRNWFEQKIMTLCPEATVIGSNVRRLPNTSMISMPNMDHAQQLIQFDLNGVSISNGSACSSGKVRRSSVLSAMGVDPKIAATCIRISFDSHHSQEEIQALTDIWYKIYSRYTEKKASYA